MTTCNENAATEYIYTRQNPFLAKLKLNQRLNTEGSGKDTRHLAFDIAGSDLKFKPGDSLGIFPQNSPQLVKELIKKMSWDAAMPVTKPDGTVSTLGQELSATYILNRANKKFVKTTASKLSGNCPLIGMSDEQLDEYIYTRDYVDILNEYPDLKLDAEEFLSLLTPISPRLYSIASSLKKYPDEAQLMLAVVCYQAHGRNKCGLASGYMAYHVPIGSALPVYVQHNRHFHLPPDGDTDIIMIGPGTGLAPFRSFLQERETEGARGRNWLFYGDRNAATDFVYKDEIEKMLKDGLLTHFDAAWSRDQEYKVYVQDKIREHGKEIWDWLQGGAWFYVCGEAKRMAKDVHQALIDIAQKFGEISPEAAMEYVNVTLMKTEQRYRRDIY